VDTNSIAWFHGIGPVQQELRRLPLHQLRGKCLVVDVVPKYYWAYGPYFDVDASISEPGSRIKNVRCQFGNMILSKTPILTIRLFPLPKSDLRDTHNMVVGVFEGVVKLQHDGALRIFNANLGARSRGDRIAQIKSIRETIRNAPAEGGAWTSGHANDLWKEDAAPPPMPEDFVLLGDFNLEAKDPEYDHLASRGDADPGRGLSRTDLLDTWTLAGIDDHEFITFSALPPYEQRG